MPHFLTLLQPRACLTAATLGLLLCTVAHAEKADRDKPMNVEADTLRYDDARQTSVFTGKVVLTKGTIIMRGSKLDVRQDPQGNQFGLLVGTSETAGFFRQKREGLEEWIEGEGDRIEYDSKTETVVFTGRAVLRRFRGPALNDESVGDQIVYNSLTEVFNVKGGPNMRTAANPTGRVRAMLTPIPEAPAGSTPPTEPAKLQPSGKISEPRK
jgi:lipopolysaccharide export system protein LptA